MRTILSMRDCTTPQASIRAIKPEWVRVPDAVKLFGIKRSKLYELIAAGRIKSREIKERGKVRGIRLISYDSLNEFIEGAAA